MPRLATTLLSALSLGFAGTAAAQERNGEDAARVLGVVQAFMAGMETKDAEAMTALVTEDSYLAFVQESPDGDRTQSISLVQAAEGLASVPSQLSEPLYDPVVMVDGPVAMVWAEFDLLVDDARSHCGVDIFTLMRTDGEWKIATVTYSHLQTGCPERQ